MMWPDLRKEAWSPGGISPGVRSHVYANDALQLTWTLGWERGGGGAGGGRGPGDRETRR